MFSSPLVRLLIPVVITGIFFTKFQRSSTTLGVSMNNYPDFYESGIQAFKNMIQNSKVSEKSLMYSLVEAKENFWSENLSYASLCAKWNACLDPNKNEFFKSAEKVHLMKISGRLDPHFYECDLLGLERSRKKTTGEELNELIEMAHSLGLMQGNLVEGINRLIEQKDAEVQDVQNVVSIEQHLRWSQENEPVNHNQY